MAIEIPLLIIVDHASNFIPSKYKNLGLPKHLTESHIAYDLNILSLSKKLIPCFNQKLYMENAQG